MKSIIIRFVITGIILVDVYYEAGPWTVAAFLLFYLHAEVIYWLMRIRVSSTQEVNAALHGLNKKIEKEIARLKR